MAAITLKTIQQLIRDKIAKIEADTDVNDLHAGASLLTVIEAASMSDLAIEAKILRVMILNNLDKVTGADLTRLARDLGVRPDRYGAEPAKVSLTLSDSSFSKVSSTIYAGSAAPLAGATSMRILSGTGFASSGTVHVGRGLASYESVAYSAIVNSGAGYWTLTLSAPLTKDHLQGEEVVMAQGGDRTVSSTDTVRAPSTGGSPVVNFILDDTYTLLDGEQSLTNVRATASLPGASGLVSVGRVVEFASLPWPTAVVTNPEPSAGGRDEESDEDLRERVRDRFHTLARGTGTSIERALIGLTDPTSSKRIISVFIRKPTTPGEYSVAYIDDGTGFEPEFSGVGIESVVTKAAGTEEDFQLQQDDITKAQLVSVESEPFDLSGGEVFSFEVDAENELVTVDDADIEVLGRVTAQELAETINRSSTLVEARSKGGKLYVTPLKDDPGYLRCLVPSTGTNANDAVKFPSNKIYTLNLYRNDDRLYQNGQAASIYSKPQNQWSGLASTMYGKFKIDGIVGPEVTIADADFALYSSSTTLVGASPSDWAKVLNAKFIGVTAKAGDDSRVRLTSNKGKDSQAAIEVLSTSGSPSLAGTIFEAGSAASGRTSDFKVNRLTGLGRLSEKLTSGDSLASGTDMTRGFLESTASATYDLSLVSGAASQLVLVPDDVSTIRTIAQSGNLTFSAPGGNLQRIVSNVSGHFSGLQAGDWVYLFGWAQVGLYKVYRVFTTSLTNDSVELFDPNPQTAASSAWTADRVMAGFKTVGRPQLVTLPSGSAVTRAAVVASINSQVESMLAAETDAGKIRIYSLRYAEGKGLTLAAVGGTARVALGFTISSEENDSPHTAALESGDLLGYPLGKISVTSADISAPYDTLVDSGAPFTAQHANRPEVPYYGSSQAAVRVPENRNSTSSLTLRGDAPAQWVGFGTETRLFSPLGLMLGEQDTLLLRLDDDSTKKNFNVPFYQDAVVSSSYVATTTQMDLEDSAGNKLASSSRWSGFRWEDFRLLMQARATLTATGANNDVALKARLYGRIGEKIQAGYYYPSVADTSLAVAHSLDSGNSIVSIAITLGSGVSRNIGTAAAQKVWVDFSGSGPGTWKFQFSDPVDLTSVAVGDIISAASGTEFAANNRKPMKIATKSNLRDVSKSFQHLQEDKVATIATGTSLTFTDGAVTQSMQVGDKIRIMGFKKQITAVGTNTITTGTGQQFAAGGGVIFINSNPYTYTSYTTGTGVFAGVSPDPAISGVLVGDFAEQYLSSPVERTVAGDIGASTATLNSSYTNDTGYIIQLIHKAVTASAAPSFTVAVNDIIQVAGQFLRVSAVVSTTVYNVDSEFTFSGLNSGVVSRIYVTATKYSTGSTEAVALASGTSVDIFPLNSDTASSVIAAINNSAGVGLLLTASNASGSSGAGTILSSTEDELGSGTAYQSLLGGESYVRSKSGSSPEFTLKEALGTAPIAGDLVKLVPATPKNAESLLSSKNFSGLPIVASTKVVGAGRKVQISTAAIGGAGQVYCLGGRANGDSTLPVYNNPRALSASRGELELDASALTMLAIDQKVKISQTAPVRKSWPSTAPTGSDTVTISNPSGSTARLTLGTAVLVSNYAFTHSGSVVWLVRRLSSGLTRFQVLSGTSSIPAGLLENDWVLVGNGTAYAGSTPASAFSAGNRGWFQVRNTDNSTYFDVELEESVEEIITTASAPFLFTSYHSARPGDKIVIGKEVPVSDKNRGTFVITNVNSTTSVDYVNPSLVVEGPIVLTTAGAAALGVNDQGYSSYRQVVALAPKPEDPLNRVLVTVSPGYDLSLHGEQYGSRLTMKGKLGFSTTPVNGTNGYEYWTGLKRLAQRVVSGYAPDSAQFEGYSAEGVFVEVREPQTQRVRLSFQVKTKEGVSLSTVSDDLKSRVISYVQSLGLGDDVVLGEVIRAAQETPGVEAVVLLSPSPTGERVTVGDRAKAVIRASDITLS